MTERCCLSFTAAAGVVHQPGCFHHDRETCPACTANGLTSVMAPVMLESQPEHQEPPE